MRNKCHTRQAEWTCAPHPARRTLATSPATSGPAAPGSTHCWPPYLHPAPQQYRMRRPGLRYLQHAFLQQFHHSFQRYSHFGSQLTLCRHQSHRWPDAADTSLQHAGGPEALLRVLCRYLKRVSDRSALPTNTATNRRHRGYQRRTTCNTETDACTTVCRRLGRDGVGVYDGRGNGMVIRGDALSPTLARGHLTVGPPRGRGPRPCVPFLGPLPQCNTVWHTRPRLIICPACTAL